MSKIDNLLEAFKDAFRCRVDELGPLERGGDEAIQAGICAVVTALRDTMVQVHLDGQEFGYADEPTAIRGAEKVVDKAIAELFKKSATMNLDELNTIGEVARQKVAREGGSIAAMTRAHTHAIVLAVAGWLHDQHWHAANDIRKALEAKP